MKKIFIYVSVLALMLCGCQTDNSDKKNSNETTESVSEISQTDEELAPQIYEGDGDDPSTLDIFAMDTYMNVKAYGENSYDALILSSDEIQKLEDIFL